MSLNTQDFLFAALAVSVIVLTGFLCVILYYVARMLREGYAMIRNARTLVDRVREMIERIEHLTSTIEQRVGNVGGILSSLSSLLERVIDARIKKRGTKGK